MSAYYNEFDAQKAAWLRELIAQGHIAPGDVDERSIHDVRPDDLRRYRQCHFFAGIGIWSYALRLAGWEDDREIWTGSCPCQPFSAAGKGEAFDDERHLWPELFRLIEARRPVVCFGEQVSSIDGLAWFDTVRGDLDDAAYTCGVLDTCAAGVGAPHRRQRLYWVADRERVGHDRRRAGEAERRQGEPERLRDAIGLADSASERRGEAWRSGGRSTQRAGDGGELGGLADGTSGGCGIERDATLAGSCGHDDGGSIARQLGIAESARSQARIGSGVQPGADGGTCARSEQAGEAERLEDALRTEWRQDQRESNGHRQAPGRNESADRAGERGETERLGNAQSSDRRLSVRERRPLAGQPESERPGPVNGFWRDANWVLTRPQRVGDRPGLRPVERKPQPMVDGIAGDVGRGGQSGFPLAEKAEARVMRLRGYGDGIVAEQAAAFVGAYLSIGGGVA